MSHNEPAKSIEDLANEILGNTRSRSWNQRERVAFSEANLVPVEEVGEQLKAYFEEHATPEQLAELQTAPFMK